MTPNQITLVRLGMSFLSVALFRQGIFLSCVALILLVITIWLDALDGYIARKHHLTSDAGAAFDIAADRIIENAYWIYFATVGLISFWIPLIVIARGCLTDFLRGLAFRQGQTAFGEKTMMQTRWGQMLTGSRLSRATYGVLKCAAFFALGVRLVMDELTEVPVHFTRELTSGLRSVAVILAVAAVAFCIVRGIPVIIEGLRFFRKTPVTTAS
jgi:CDP-diacylglycerol--glycerol-3-phosphate 3-phosphatidyltransferase